MVFVTGIRLPVFAACRVGVGSDTRGQGLEQFLTPPGLEVKRLEAFETRGHFIKEIMTFRGQGPEVILSASGVRILVHAIDFIYDRIMVAKSYERIFSY